MAGTYVVLCSSADCELSNELANEVQTAVPHGIEDGMVNLVVRLPLGRVPIAGVNDIIDTRPQSSYILGLKRQILGEKFDSYLGDTTIGFIRPV